LRKYNNKVDVAAYDGSNEYLNRVLEDSDGPVWIVNGPSGRRPIMAKSAQEAKQVYFDKYTDYYVLEEEE
jgi:hypothetical protein